MTESSHTTPNLLIIEDNVELQKEIQQEAAHIGWHPTNSRSIEEAKEVLETSSKNLRLMILDVMVLKTRADVVAVDALLSRREQFVWKKTGEGMRTDFSLDELHTIRKELTAFDSEIQRHVDYDGGLNFLIWAKRAGLLNGIRIAIFTARDSAKEDIRKRIQDCISTDNFVNWFSKPRHPQAFVDFLRSEYEQL
jgi:hypothetical protein